MPYDHVEADDPSTTWTISTPLAGIAVTALNLITVASSLPIVGVHNPATSGVRVNIRRAICQIVTGTAATFVWGAITTSTIVVTSGAARRHSDFAVWTSTLSKAIYFNGTQAVVGTPNYFRLLAGPLAGATIVGQNCTYTESEDEGGSLVLLPGATIGIFADVVTAGPVRASLTVTEIPLPTGRAVP